MPTPTPDDPPDPFEADLRRFTPRAPAPTLEACLAAALDPAPVPPASPWPDRCLLATLTTAALAACLALAVTLVDNPPPEPAPARPLTNAPTLLDTPRALARLDRFDFP